MEQVASTLPGSAKIPRKLNRETFIHSNSQISICLHVAMLSMLNYQSKVIAVGYSLMKSMDVRHTRCDQNGIFKPLKLQQLLYIVLTLSSCNSGATLLIINPNVSSEEHFTIVLLLR